MPQPRTSRPALAAQRAASDALFLAMHADLKRRAVASSPSAAERILADIAVTIAG